MAMSWMIVASIVAALVVTAAVIWFRWMEARHEHAFAEQEKRLNSGELVHRCIQPIHFGEDLVGVLGPDEGVGVSIMDRVSEVVSS